MVAERVRHMTVAEYLVFEEGSEIKHEYLDGEIYPMTGGTAKHSSITINIIVALNRRLEPSDCELHSSDMRIKVGPTRYVYPDLSVVCGKAAFEDNDSSLVNPTSVVEVTSPSSVDYDRAMKRDYYKAVTSLEIYMVVDQHRLFVELYTRSESGWHIQSFAGLEDVIPLGALDCSLPLSEIYRGLVFEAETPSTSEGEAQ